MGVRMTTPKGEAMTMRRARKKNKLEEALHPGPWYGQERVAFLNDAGDLVLQVRRRRGTTPRTWRMEVVTSTVVTGSQAKKLAALIEFGANIERAS